MSGELLERAKLVVAEARRRGAQHVRAGVQRRRSAETEWRDGKLDRIRESTKLGLSLSLFVDGRYSAHSTSDLRPEAIGRFLEDAIASTRVLAADPHRRLPDPSRFADRFDGDLRIFDAAGAGALDPMARRRAARDLEEAARAAPGADQIVSVTASAGDDSTDLALCTSNGMEGSERSTTFWRWAEVSVRDQEGRKPEGFWLTQACLASDLLPLEEVGREATQRALAQVGAAPIESGQHACVVENAVGRRLLGHLLEPLSGYNIQQQRSFYADKLGASVASAALDASDDPLLPAGLASRSFDSEGMSCARRPLFERGVLRTFFLDTYYASKLEREPTTAMASNLVFTPGTRDLAGLLAAMGKGLLITGFSGGNSNSATGDFSVGVRGHWVEGGRPVRPVAEMNLAGNHLTFWHQLREVGSDPYPASSMRTPSLRFDAVQFSGV